MMRHRHLDLGRLAAAAVAVLEDAEDVAVAAVGAAMLQQVMAAALRRRAMGRQARAIRAVALPARATIPARALSCDVLSMCVFAQRHILQHLFRI